MIKTKAEALEFLGDRYVLAIPQVQLDRQPPKPERPIPTYIKENNNANRQQQRTRRVAKGA